MKRQHVLTCWLGGKGKAIPTIFKAPDPAGRKLQHPTGGVPPFPLPQQDCGLASILALGSPYGEAAGGCSELPPARLPGSCREAQACAESRERPKFLTGVFYILLPAGLLCLGVHCWKEKKKVLSCPKWHDKLSPSCWHAPPPTLLQPRAWFSHIHLGALLLHRALTSLYSWLLISLCPAFAGRAPILPLACVHPHGPRAPAPVFFRAGGPPCSPASSGGALSGTQVSYYSLLEGYYRLTHLENYSFFRPFRNFNELF